MFGSSNARISKHLVSKSSDMMSLQLIGVVFAAMLQVFNRVTVMHFSNVCLFQTGDAPRGRAKSGPLITRCAPESHSAGFDVSVMIYV